ncbi:MAG: 5-(carboxyamino)imidazole ribonucleotide mutase [Lentisphaeria bacterium]|jgi:5-(carboxyamino)imidazole ribonucleotide mutase|nr:5-(carboxyamino)imidazole ribonucleotide mutase [Lentisphaeria bacterium]
MTSKKVAVLMGSKSDLPKLQGCLDCLAKLEISHELRIMSAHRTPEIVAEFAGTAAAKGFGVIIAAAGGAAHLAGVVAAHSLLPVIGIPVENGAFKGLDALLSTVQMPGGIAVACVGVGGGGATNAALLAAQILALSDSELAQRLAEERRQRRAQVIEDDRELQL